MKKLSCVILLGMGTVAVWAHLNHTASSSQQSKQTVRATPGENPWNQGRPPTDWWAAIKQMHGHVGPWNVLGWRIGRAALREFDATWGRHQLDIICYVPMTTPYSCIADGLVIGTGNSIGRLDIRLAEVMTTDLILIAVRRKHNSGPVLIFRPKLDFLKRIEIRPVEELEELSRQCSVMEESRLFHIERFEISKTQE
jgi:formylmethanofuran dehydrogenase subunit E